MQKITHINHRSVFNAHLQLHLRHKAPRCQFASLQLRTWEN